MNVLVLDFFREIWKTRGRFIAIFMIVAIGCGFFAGVKVTCPDMLLTAETYFKNQNLMDFQLKSTYGFNQEDIDAIKKDSNIKNLSFGYTTDFFVAQEVSEDFIVRAYSYKADDSVDKLVLKEGRFPTASNECLAEKSIVSKKALDIGNQITLKTDKDTNIGDVLTTDTYKIVGIVESPVYITLDRGTSKLGNGEINSFIYLPFDNFKYEYYTDIFLTLNNTIGVSPFSDQYNTLISDFTDSLEGIAEVQQKVRFESTINEATNKLNQSKADLQTAIDKSDSEFGSAKKQLDNAKTSLEKGKLDYVSNIDKFNSEISDAQAKITAAEQELQKGLSDYNTGKAQYDAALKQQNDALAKLSETNSIITDLEDAVAADASSSADNSGLIAKITNSSLDQTVKDKLLPLLSPLNVNGLNTVIASMKQAAAESQTKLDAAAKTLAETAATLEQSKAKLDAGKSELDNNKSLLEENKKSGQQKLDEAYNLLKKSEGEIASNEASYYSEKAKADAKINDAKIEISNGEKKISELKNPKWYIFDRNNNPGYSNYETDAQRVNKIAAVFPIFFILVAALVCLTTMARMVEEQRTQIGVLKALGYSKTRILAKYLGYAAAASILGSAIGLSIGFQLFPKIIFNAYKILYNMPDIIAKFRVDYAVLCTLAAVLCTTLSAFSVCFAELHAVPAELMRPKAPKKGKRVFLERITPLWSRLSFIYKVTFRNIFRYKKRVLMTVVGIAGCTALMLTGFGLRYSISSIIDKQFGEIFHYDIIGMVDSDIDNASMELVTNQLSSNEYLDSMLLTFQKTYSVSKGDKKKDVTLFVPENISSVEKNITMKNRKTQKQIAFSETGVIITEKISRMLNLRVGDKIKLTGTDDSIAETDIVGIVENYINNYVYLSPGYYKTLFGSEPKYNSFIGTMIEDTSENRNQLSSSLLKNSDILGVSFVTKSADKIRDLLNSLDLIVLVMIISAGSLAFVVLYNLTNINVTERQRELATIKVLGFYNSELSKYIYRENIISTAVGILLGLLIGIPFDNFVIATSEVDAVMFTPGINPPSFLFAALLTVIFAAIVNAVLYIKLKKINMVESLKSIE